MSLESDDDVASIETTLIEWNINDSCRLSRHLISPLVAGIQPGPRLILSNWEFKSDAINPYIARLPHIASLTSAQLSGYEKPSTKLSSVMMSTPLALAGNLSIISRIIIAQDTLGFVYIHCRQLSAINRSALSWLTALGKMLLEEALKRRAGSSWTNTTSVSSLRARSINAILSTSISDHMTWRRSAEL